MQLPDLTVDVILARTSSLSCRLNVYTILAQQTLHTLMPRRQHGVLQSDEPVGCCVDAAICLTAPQGAVLLRLRCCSSVCLLLCLAQKAAVRMGCSVVATEWKVKGYYARATVCFAQQFYLLFLLAYALTVPITFLTAVQVRTHCHLTLQPQPG
jgi:hypothetical protein